MSALCPPRFQKDSRNLCQPRTLIQANFNLVALICLHYEFLLEKPLHSEVWLPCSRQATFPGRPIGASAGLAGLGLEFPSLSF